MSKLKPIDTAKALHDIANFVEDVIGISELSDNIRQTADLAHSQAVADTDVSDAANIVIDKAKQ
jgi:hypothetical protein